MKHGTVYWITGLSGAGKTTIGRSLYHKLKRSKPDLVFLDGDMLREVFGNTAGYSLAERKQLAMKYSRLCGILSEQGIDVVCATISLFKEVHAYNRAHLKKYYEIFVDCHLDELIKRDQKGIYSKTLTDKAGDVIGIDLSYDRPEKCDLVIDNTNRDALDEKVDRIIRFISGK